MNFDVLKFFTLLLTLPLASCGGSGGDGSPVETAFDDIVGAHGSLSMKYPIGPDNVTADENLPPVGSERYSGILILPLSTSEITDIWSRISLEVNFAGRDFEGFAYDFYDNNGIRLDVVSEDSVRLDENLLGFNGSYPAPCPSDCPDTDERIKFDLRGYLMRDSSLVIQLDLAMTGDFVDYDGAFAEGINGNAIGPAWINGSSIPLVGGDFYTEREQP